VIQHPKPTSRNTKASWTADSVRLALCPSLEVSKRLEKSGDRRSHYSPENSASPCQSQPPPD
jgi:hypothetical protein